MSNPLLQGVRILDLSRLLPGPFCTLQLAQLGAEVIKLEEPNGGDYTRTMFPELFALVNRGKRSVTLDLRQPDGVAILKRLVRDADVLLEGFRPGVMDRLGCGWPVLRAENPKLVYAALTGYGQDGPYRDRSGHDINYCGYAGALDQVGTADGPPALGNTQIADLAGGALNAALGILAALLGARASGQGAFVDAAMLDGTLALQVVPLATLRTQGSDPARGADMLTGGLPNYGVYECADGRHLAVGALEPKFFAKLCAAAGRPELQQQPVAPGPAGATLRQAMIEMFRSRPRGAWLEILEGADACVGPVLAPSEALGNVQVQGRGVVEDDGGKPAFALPLAIDGSRGTAVGPAPALGQDTDAILQGAGFDAAARRRFRTQRST